MASPQSECWCLTGRTDGDRMTLLAALLLPLVAAQPRIINLSGSAAYKKVSLHWAVDNDGEAPTGLFRLKFCENQIWGEHYCQERLLEDNPDKPEFSTDIYGRTGLTFMTIIVQT